MKVAIFGDTHGQWNALDALLVIARDRQGVEAAIQVGDMALNRKTIQRFTETVGKFAIPLFVIDGNHEDHDFIARAVKRQQTRTWSEQLNLNFQPRASTANFAGSSVGFIGGALNVVGPQHHGIFSGAPNYVRQRDALRAASAFNHTRSELIVSHSCPSGIGIGMTGHPNLEAALHEHVIQAGFDPGPIGDRGESALRTLWDQLQYRPRTWVFGHFHLSWRVEVQSTQFACVSPVDATSTREIVCWDSNTYQLTTEPL